MSKLSINLIVYSEKETKYIPYLFESLKKQTFQDWEMLVLNNNSDGSVMSVVEEKLKDSGKPYRVINSKENLGFASGHNLLYKEAQTPYVLLQNPDMFLMPDALEKMVGFLDAHKEVSTVSTRLMRWDFAKVEQTKPELGFTNSIDAIGIRLLRNRRALEWLTRQEWVENSEDKNLRSIFGKSIIEVFGVSGALAMYRKKSLDKVLLPGENIFDPTYHSYKEDLDLAYRLRNMGFTSYILLDAVAYHDRTGAGPKKTSDWAAARNKKDQSFYVRFHSYKNHLRTLYKNEYWQNFIIDFPFIFWLELKKFVFILITDPKILIKSWVEIIKNFSYTNSARKLVKKSRKMYWKGLRRWFYV